MFWGGDSQVIQGWLTSTRIGEALLYDVHIILWDNPFAISKAVCPRSMQKVFQAVKYAWSHIILPFLGLQFFWLTNKEIRVNTFKANLILGRWNECTESQTIPGNCVKCCQHTKCSVEGTWSCLYLWWNIIQTFMKEHFINQTCIEFTHCAFHLTNLHHVWWLLFDSCIYYMNKHHTPRSQDHTL